MFGFVDNFLLYSLFCASRIILFVWVEKFQNKPQKFFFANLACFSTCV